MAATATTLDARTSRRRPMGVRLIAPAIVGGLLVAGLNNVFGDSAAVEYRGRVEACAARGPSCIAALTRLVRTPFFQALRFRTPSGVVDVRCTRSLYLVGPYSCAVQSPG